MRAHGKGWPFPFKIGTELDLLIMLNISNFHFELATFAIRILGFSTKNWSRISFFTMEHKTRKNRTEKQVNTFVRLFSSKHSSSSSICGAGLSKRFTEHRKPTHWTQPFFRKRCYFLEEFTRTLFRCDHENVENVRFQIWAENKVQHWKTTVRHSSFMCLHFEMSFFVHNSIFAHLNFISSKNWSQNINLVEKVKS